MSFRQTMQNRCLFGSEQAIGVSIDVIAMQIVGVIHSINDCCSFISNRIIRSNKL